MYSTIFLVMISCILHVFNIFTERCTTIKFVCSVAHDMFLLVTSTLPVRTSIAVYTYKAKLNEITYMLRIFSMIVLLYVHNTYT